MQFVDTHCHIQEANAVAPADDMVQSKWAQAGITTPDEMISDAVKAGVEQLICVGCTLRDSKLAVELAARNDHCYATIGIHPHEAKDQRGKHVLADFTELANNPSVKAI